MNKRELVGDSLLMLANSPPGELISRAYLQAVRNMNVFGAPEAGEATFVMENMVQVIKLLKDNETWKEVKAIIEDLS